MVGFEISFGSNHPAPTGTHQRFYFVLARTRSQSPPLDLLPPPLQLLVCHELDRSVGNAEEGEDHALAETADALFPRDLVESIC